MRVEYQRKVPRPPAQLLAFAQELRGQQTDAEILLWYLLRDRRLDGYKFRRQHALYGYIADFYCAQAKLVIELDGSQHLDAASDDARTRTLAGNGIRILRFWNDQVLKQTEEVLTAIWQELHHSTLTPDPSPSRGRGDQHGH